MPNFNRTYRIQGEERIMGSWRHIFTRNGDTYYLSDLKVYADGMIDYGMLSLIDLNTFKQKVAEGWVATTIPQGAEAHAHNIAIWRFDEPYMFITPQQLIAEVADEIEHLAGRPTSEDRCRSALDRYLDVQSEENLKVLREAYYAVPEHRRRGLLYDQDAKDRPLRFLITPIGERVYPEYTDDDVAQPSDHENALAYFLRRREEEQRLQVNPPFWHDDAVTNSPSVVRFIEHDGGLPYLGKDYPAPVTLDGITYPTLEHAYWALATSDPDSREKINNAPTALEARKRGYEAPLRPNWNTVRLAVMIRLVREKFHQHPDLAAQLIATGDGRLINGSDVSRYWGQGRNWLGRILEIVRAELQETDLQEKD